MFECHKTEGLVTFTFVPKLDTAVCLGKEEEMVSELGDYKGRVDFDLTGVEYISSYFLRIITAVYKHVGEGNLKAQNAAPFVKKVFKIAGFDKIL